MSPEHLLGRSVDERTDVYALGLIGYEMLLRHPVVNDDGTVPHLLEIIRRQVEVVPPLLHHGSPRIPLDVSLAIGRAMEKDPELRWRNASELAAALRACAVYSAVAATAPSTDSIPTARMPPSAPSAIAAPAPAPAHDRPLPHTSTAPMVSLPHRAEPGGKAPVAPSPRWPIVGGLVAGALVTAGLGWLAAVATRAPESTLPPPEPRSATERPNTAPGPSGSPGVPAPSAGNDPVVDAGAPSDEAPPASPSVPSTPTSTPRDGAPNRGPAPSTRPKTPAQPSSTPGTKLIF